MSGPDLDPQSDSTADSRPALLVVNHASRFGAAAADQTCRALEAAGVAVRPELCSQAADLPDLIRRLAPDIRLVAIGGGDGTLNAALPALLDANLPLGILPVGTANDLARTLGIPNDPAEAARIIAAGRRRRIDVGDVNGCPFLNVASIGFGVDLTQAITHDAKKRWGTLGYAVAGIRALRRLTGFTVEIEEAGTVQRRRTVHLAVGNGRHYGGGMTVSENASIEDGRLDIYSLEVRSIWRLLMLLPALRRGSHGRWEEVHTRLASDITVRTRRPRSVDTDGEITARTPARFRVLPKALDVFVP